MAASSNNFEPLLRLSRGEKHGTDRARAQILANCYEAVIGAIYLDKGYQSAKEFIERTLLVTFDDILKTGSWMDPKSHLQEKAQSKEGFTPVYSVLEEDGPDHDKTFVVGVFVGENLRGKGTGPSKQSAQQQAAQDALKFYNVNDIIYPKTTITPPRFVTTEDVSQMIKVTTKGRDKAVISLLYASGLRSSELSGLNRSSLTGNQLQILGKGHKYRLGFIDARTAFLIATYLDGRNDNLAPLFITNRGTRLEKEIIARIVKTAVLSAGLDESVTPHTLRHGYATNLLRNGCNLRYIQELLGHSNIQTTMLYTHVLDDDLSTNYKRYHSI